jgi:uncharacterized protein with HEPN domain
MPRDYRVFLQDALNAIDNVSEFIGTQAIEEFKADKRTVHAVVRNLEVLGEAVKGVPPDVRSLHPEVPWQRIAGLRDILIHHYFEIDIDIVWDIVQNKLPELKEQPVQILDESPGLSAP